MVEPAKVTCFLSPVVALPVTKVQLRNPTLGVRGKLVVFPVTLESGQYIEMESAGNCRHFDERGALTAKIAPQGEVPRLDPEETSLTFTCEGPPGLHARVKVTVITLGEPIGPPVRP